MANPQKENGYTAVANEIMEALCRTRIPGEERQVLDAILRKTYGWNKCEDEISLSQLSLMTGLKRPNVARAIKGLVSKAILGVIKSDTSITNTLKFNKNYEQWVVSKKIPSIKSDNTLVSKAITEGGIESDTYKRNKKTTYTKDNIYIVEIVAYLNEKTGKNFSPKSKTTQSHIKARLAEGHGVDAFKTVIDNKCAKWLHDSKMMDYLRPVTLFGNKFESYLNENVNPLQGKVSDTTLHNINVLKNWSPKNAE